MATAYVHNVPYYSGDGLIAPYAEDLKLQYGS